MKCCTCCHAELTSEVVLADVYNDGRDLEYCSAECVEHCEEEEQEYLDSYDV